MKKKGVILKLLAILAAALFLIIAVWSVWPGPAYDLSRVNPRLSSLQKPYISVKTFYFSDGGSVGIEIVGRDGKSEQFALSAHLGETNRYTKVFVGAIYDRREGTIEIADPEPTKQMLVEILGTWPNKNANDDFCLMCLRRRPIDIMRVLIHKWRGDYRL